MDKQLKNLIEQMSKQDIKNKKLKSKVKELEGKQSEHLDLVN
jgi:hypothetical protein